MNDVGKTSYINPINFGRSRGKFTADEWAILNWKIASRLLPVPENGVNCSKSLDQTGGDAKRLSEPVASKLGMWTYGWKPKEPRYIENLEDTPSTFEHIFAVSEEPTKTADLMA